MKKNVHIYTKIILLVFCVKQIWLFGLQVWNGESMVKYMKLGDFA